MFGYIIGKCIIIRINLDAKSNTRFMIYIIPVALIVLLGYMFLIKKKKDVKLPEENNNRLSDNWEELLVKHVSFYKGLNNKDDKDHFKSRMIDFLSQIRIVGVGCEVEELDRVLIAASAIIPVFKFPNWRYLNFEEVVLRPHPFNENYDNHSPKNISGMVGTGYLNGKMILSKSSLRLGFQANNDKKNVGIHEFVHLIDGIDGSIDGIPEVLMTQQYVLPWLDLIHKKTIEIREGDSEINAYGATNQQEFLSVVSEYFFEHPFQLKRKHPELYKMLSYFYAEKE